MKKKIASGAEADIYEDESTIIKERLKKDYRIKEIDDRLRVSRTNREVKILEKLGKAGILAPKLIRKDDFSIMMEKIEGSKVRDVLERQDCRKISRQVGGIIAKLHDLGIIHGDLTTSNMIKKEEDIFLIDFGLSFFSEKVEDKAVDLHLFEQALESKHYTISEECFKEFLKGYKPKKREEIIKRLREVKKRGKNKAKY